MRFDPKIVRPSEEAEAALPDELAQLAAQLQDDAAHLAALYPAVCASELPSKPRSRRLQKAVVWIGVGTLASILLALAIALPWVLPVPGSNGPAADPTDLVVTEGGRESGERQTNSQSPMEKSSPSVSTPALFLQNISGPELEGLFDLWEADAVEQGRISI